MGAEKVPYQLKVGLSARKVGLSIRKVGFTARKANFLAEKVPCQRPYLLLGFGPRQKGTIVMALRLFKIYCLTNRKQDVHF
jgi:hypothetical protein